VSRVFQAIFLLVAISKCRSTEKTRREIKTQYKKVDWQKVSPAAVCRCMDEWAWHVGGRNVNYKKIVTNEW